MELFIGQNLLKFRDRFRTDENRKEYLVDFKWKNGFL